MKQTNMNLYKGTRGGRRPNSGRKRLHSAGVNHKGRPEISPHYPLYINFKYKSFIRTDKVLNILETAINNAEKFHLIVTHFTIQTNHIHLIAEAIHKDSLIKGMRSITNTIVKQIGKGSIQLERYHLHVLKSPLELINAIHYVQHNDFKHGNHMNTKFTQEIKSGKSWLMKNFR